MDVIRDKFDREFDVSLSSHESLIDFEIRDAGVRVGYAYTRISGSTFVVDDLHIKDKALRPANWFMLRLPVKWRERNYRDRGLGSALLQFVIAYAKNKGLKRLEGTIKRADYEVNPHLPQWYRKHGFTVVMQPAGSIAIAKTFFDLS